MNWSKETPFQALALTGGGYQVLFNACALQLIEDELKAPIWRSFDLACGTSIRGIEAPVRLAFEVPMSKVVSVFSEYGENIFPLHTPPSSGIGQLMDLWRYAKKPRYDTAPLREAISKLIPADTLLGDALHPVAIPAVNVTLGKQQFSKRVTKLSGFVTGNSRRLTLHWLPQPRQHSLNSQKSDQTYMQTGGCSPMRQTSLQCMKPNISSMSQQRPFAY